MVTRIVALDEEAGDPLVLCTSPDHGDVCERGVADPPLLPIQDVAAALLDGGCREGAGVAPGLGFGEAEAAYLLALRHRGKPLLLLLLRAEVVDRRHRQAALDVQEGRQASRAAGQLRYCEAVGHVIPPGAAVLRWEGATRDPGLRQARQQVKRELGFVPVFGRRGDDLPVHKGAYLVLYLLLSIREEATRVDEVHRLRPLPGCLGRDGHGLSASPR